MGIAGNAVTIFGLTGTNSIDGHLSGSKWSDSALPYGYPLDAASYGSTWSFSNEYTPTQKDCAAYCYAQIARFCNVTVPFVTESGSTHGILRGYNYATGPSGTFPSTTGSTTSVLGGGDIQYQGWVASGGTYNARSGGSNFATGTDEPFVPGQIRWWAMHHETGHTLGLKHSDQTYNQNGATFPVLSARNSNEYTCMIGGSFPGNETDGLHQNYPEGTISAFQQMYGVNTTSEANRTLKWMAATGEAKINGTRDRPIPLSNRVNETWWKYNDGDKFDLTDYPGDMTFSTAPDSWLTFNSAQLANIGGGMAQGNVHLCSFGGRLADLELGPGNYTITVNGASQYWIGGAGTCTAVFTGALANYSATKNGAGDYTLTDNRALSPDGTTRLKNFTQATFTGGTVQMSTFDTAPSPSKLRFSGRLWVH